MSQPMPDAGPAARRRRRRLLLLAVAGVLALCAGLALKRIVEYQLALHDPNWPAPSHLWPRQIDRVTKYAENLYSPDELTRKAAAEELVRLGAEGAQPLAAAMACDRPQVRDPVIEALRWCDDPQVLTVSRSC
ncbi:MAG: hypothetical protein AB7Y46_07195 [Armatimonadota bacterium]